MSTDQSSVIQTAKKYYDSHDAYIFYTTVWGGEEHHLGIYRTPEDSLFQASRRIIDRMASYSSQLQELGNKARLLDLGSGYGGTARHLAKTFGCQVVGLNLSETENIRHREKNQEQGLDKLIEVVDGNFERIPYEENSFDVVWSQDSFLHSPDREQVIKEATRVLKPGGEFIFTDPMQTEDAYPEYLDPILKRIHLASLATPSFYFQTAEKMGLKLKKFENLQVQLANHYAKVLEDTIALEDQLREKEVSQEYLDHMKKGLKHWSDGGQYGHLTWGLFCFQKPGK